MAEHEDRVMHIGEVAARTELSLRTLRHYDEIGLLTPSGRSDGGFRLYTEADVDRLLVVRRMKPLGFSLEEMREVLGVLDVLADPAAGDDDRRAATGRLAEVGDRAREERARLQRQLAMADEFVDLVGRRITAGG